MANTLGGKEKAAIIIALITSLSGSLTSVLISQKASDKADSKSDLATVRMTYDLISPTVNNLIEEVQRLHDKVYGINHSSGGEDEDAGCPADTGKSEDVGVERIEVDCIEDKVEERRPLRIKKLPTFDSLMKAQEASDAATQE